MKTATASPNGSPWFGSLKANAQDLELAPRTEQALRPFTTSYVDQARRGEISALFLQDLTNGWVGLVRTLIFK